MYRVPSLRGNLHTGHSFNRVPRDRKRGDVYNRCSANLFGQSPSKSRPERKTTADIVTETPTAMWTALLLLLLISSFDVGATRKPLRTETSLVESDSSDSSLESMEHAARLPRRFRGNSRTRRLHIENQTTGFDGKVEKINVNSEEDLAEIRAYALRNTKLANNGHVPTTSPRMDTKKDTEFGPRAVRSIEAYGKSKEHLETNGEIERVQAPIPRHQTRRGAGSRLTRSIETAQPEASAKDTDDLEAQDAKVFRPLFVYRQQLAKRQNRGKNQIHGYRTFEPYYLYRRPVYL